MSNVIVINEETMNDIKGSLTMTKYKFRENVKYFLSKLIADPINAKSTMLLKYNGLDYNPRTVDSDKNGNKLIYKLLEYGIIVRKRKISDHDENGEPKNASMIVSYSVPKRINLNRTLERLYIDLFEQNTYEDIELSEDGCGGATSCGGAGLDGDNTLLTPLTTVQRRKINNVNESIILNEDHNGDKARKIIKQALINRKQNPDQIVTVNNVDYKLSDTIYKNILHFFPILQPNSQLGNGAKFQKGVARMWANNEFGENFENGNIDEFKHALYELVNKYYNDYNSDFNGLSSSELIKLMAPDVEKTFSDKKEKIKNKEYEDKGYQIIKIESHKQLFEYRKYCFSGDIWCIMGDNVKDKGAIDMYNSYTRNGVFQFYLCLKNGIKENDIPPIPDGKTKGDPKDSYGISMLGVIVEDNGSLSSCVSRWNDSGDKFTEEEISEIVGKNFYNTFLPNTKIQDEINYRLSYFNKTKSLQNSFDVYHQMSEGTYVIGIEFEKEYDDYEDVYQDEYDEDEYNEDGYDEYDDEDDENEDKIIYYNYITSDGKLISDKWFDECYDFNSGYGLVYNEKDGYNFININGEFLLEKWVSEAESFYNGFAEIHSEDIKYINTKGEVCNSDEVLKYEIEQVKKTGDVSASFNVVSIFYGFDFYLIKFNRKYNLINNEGKILSPNIWFNDVNTVNNGLLIVRVYGPKGEISSNYLDFKGNFLLDEWVSWGGRFIDGYALIRNDQGQENLIDIHGHPLFSEWQEKITNYYVRGEVLTYEIDGKKRNIYLNGEEYTIDSELFKKNVKEKIEKELIRLRNSERAFKNSKYEVIEVDNLYNFIDINGNLLRPDMWFDECKNFFEYGLCEVKKDGKTYYIDENGELKNYIDYLNAGFDSRMKVYNETGSLNDAFNLLNEFRYDKLEYYDHKGGEFHSGKVIRISFNGMYNILVRGDLLFRDKWFNYIDGFNEGLAKVSIHDTWNFINLNGEFLEPRFMFDSCDNFYNKKVAQIRKGNEINFININGEYLFEEDNGISWAGNFIFKLCQIFQDGEYKLINTSGKSLVDDAKIDKIEYYHSLGLFTVISGDKYKIASIYTGELVSDEWFDINSNEPFNKFSIYKDGVRYKYDDKTNTVVPFNEVTESVQNAIDNYLNKIDEATTASGVGEIEYDVPVFGDEETLSRGNGVGGSTSINYVKKKRKNKI